MKHRSRFALATYCAALAFSLVACGGDKDNPDAVDFTELKAPGGLIVRDDGNGKVTLLWQTSNFEKEFEGYNVYGAKIDPETANIEGLKEGESIQLLDDAGEEREDVKKNIMAAFDYSKANDTGHLLVPTESAPDYSAEAKLADDDSSIGGNTSSDKEKLSFYPIHSQKDKEAILPSCRPADSTCTFLTQDSPAKDAAEIKSTGTVEFTMPDDITLSIGEKYCFFVFAVKDGGETVSQASTNVACVIPEYKKELALTKDGTNPYVFLKLSDYRAACTPEAGCPDVSTTYFGGYSSSLTASSTGTTAGLEFLSSKAHVTPAKNVGAKELRYCAEGFQDTDCLSQPDGIDYIYDKENSEGKVVKTKNGNGYTIPGLSLMLHKNFTYVLAEADGDTGKFFYYRFWVKELDNTNSTATIELRVPSQSR